MKNLLYEIKNILLEDATSIKTPASSELDSASEDLSSEISKQSLKAAKKTKTKSRDRSDVEEEDIVSKSKEDLEKKDDEEEDEDVESKKIKTNDESPSTINLSDAMNFEKLIDILNQFRAAHSFTDESVSSRLKDYFDSLEREEKEVLHILIKGLVQITVLDVDGKDAYTPSKLMFDIKKTGSASSERKKSIKRKIDNSQNSGSDKSKNKDSGGLPIITIGSGVMESYKGKKNLIDIVKRNNN